MIHERACEPGLRLGQIAASVGRSRYWLSRLIKRRTGGTFWQLVDRLRIDEVKVHLRDPATSVKEAAARVGWQTAQLDHQFKRLVGASPTAWRAGLPSRRGRTK